MIRKLLSGVLAACLTMSLVNLPIMGAGFQYSNDFDSAELGSAATLVSGNVYTGLTAGPGYSGDAFGGDFTKSYKNELGGRGVDDYSFVLEKSSGTEVTTTGWPGIMYNFESSSSVISAEPVVTIETSMYFGDFNVERFINVRQSVNNRLFRITTSGAIEAQDGAGEGTFKKVSDAKLNTWYKFSMVVYLNTNTYDFYINEELVNRTGKYTMGNTLTAIDTIRYQYGMPNPATGLTDVSIILGIDDFAFYSGQPTYEGNVPSDLPRGYANDFNTRTVGQGASLTDGANDYGFLEEGDSIANHSIAAPMSSVYRSGLGDKGADDVSFVFEKATDTELSEQREARYNFSGTGESNRMAIKQTEEFLTIEQSVYFGDFNVGRDLDIRMPSWNVLLTVAKSAGATQSTLTVGAYSKPVQTEQWYKIAFVFHIGTNNYDFYFDREKVNKTAPLVSGNNNSVVNFESIRYLFQPGGTVEAAVPCVTAIDDVEFYYGEPDYAGDPGDPGDPGGFDYKNDFNTATADQTGASLTSTGVNLGELAPNGQVSLMNSIGQTAFRKALGGRQESDISYAIEKLPIAVDAGKQMVAWYGFDADNTPLAEDTILTIETAMYIGDANAKRTIDVRVPSSNALVVIEKNAEGVLKIFASNNGQKEVATAEVGKWYKFTMVLYGNTNNYDLYIDEQKVNGTRPFKAGQKAEKLGTVRYVVDITTDLGEGDEVVTGIDDVAFYSGQPTYFVPNVDAPYYCDFNFDASNPAEVAVTIQVENASETALKGKLLLAAYDEFDRLLDVDVDTEDLEVEGTVGATGTRTFGSVDASRAKYLKAFFWSAKEGETLFELDMKPHDMPEIAG